MKTKEHPALFDSSIAEFGLAADIDLDILQDGRTPTAVLGSLEPQLAELIERHRPITVVVEGDTVSAFAGALAASYARRPLAHVEASATSGSAEAFHHGDEVGKARGDWPGVVDGDGSAGVEPQNREAHGDAVIELGSHHPATGNGVAA